MLEKDIQKQIIEWLQFQRQTFIWRQNAGMAIGSHTDKSGKTSNHVFRSSSAEGISDIIGIWHSRPIAIEVKRPGKKATPKQEEFLRKFKFAGGIAIEAHSLDEVIAELQRTQL